MPYFREIYPVPAAYMISKLGVKWGLELMNREVDGTTVKIHLNVPPEHVDDKTLKEIKEFIEENNKEYYSMNSSRDDYFFYNIKYILHYDASLNCYIKQEEKE